MVLTDRRDGQTDGQTGQTDEQKGQIDEQTKLSIISKSFKDIVLSC